MTQILVLGAGMSGATAAHDLVAAGHEVVVVEKGHVPGGRVSTRTVNGAVFDVGAQFLTAKSEQFREQVDDWQRAAIVDTWFAGSPDAAAEPGPDAHPRFRGSPTMRHLALHVTNGLDLKLGTVVSQVESVGSGWRLHATDRDKAPVAPLEAGALVLSAPVPQLLALLDAGSVPLDRSHREQLDEITYEPCLTVLGIPRGKPELPARGAVRFLDGDIAWITDNQVSGASGLPALTIHAGPAFSRAHFDAPRDEVGRRIADLAAPLLGTNVEVAHVHGWRYAAPVTHTAQASLLDTTTGAPLVVVGDALGGSRIEGAVRSGHHGAARLVDHLAAMA